MLKQRVSLFLLPLLLFGFIFGLIRLFQLRMNEGDVYPPYSSLRSDPLGAKIFYASLDRLSDFNSQRLYEPLSKVESGGGKTLFLLGTQMDALRFAEDSDLKDIETFARAGGRVVIALSPLNSKSWNIHSNEPSSVKDGSEKKSKKKASEKIKTDSEFKFVSFWEKWGLAYDFGNLEINDEKIAEPVLVTLAADNISLPEGISWHSAVYFHDLTNNWNAVYERKTNQAVIIERSFGSGTIVIATDSYLFSNEAMLKDRHADLLAWFVGAEREAIFDETHLGVQGNPGIAALARKYRLHGFIFSLLILAALFVWKNSSSFIPAHDDEIFEGRSAVVSGKDSNAGFINLLRRGISPSEILSATFEEWKKSSASSRARSGKKFAQVEALVNQENSLSARDRQPVKIYHAIATLLTERK